MFDKEYLIKIANLPMPFGKYSGRVLIDIPEEYYLWFQKKEWPKGELGELMQLTLEIKANGLETIIDPLRNKPKNLSY